MAGHSTRRVTGSRITGAVPEEVRAGQSRPTAAAMAGALLPTDQLERAQKELELMSIVAADFSDVGLTDKSGVGVDEKSSILTPAEGQALRAVRVLLFEIDRLRAFGGMQRVQAASGDFLWVCKMHYHEYDPGLPTLP